MGMPKRWLLPTTMSAPHSPGAVIRVRASRSAATMKAACRACTCCTSARRSSMRPLLAGDWAEQGKVVAGQCRLPLGGALGAHHLDAQRACACLYDFDGLRVGVPG